MSIENNLPQPSAKEYKLVTMRDELEDSSEYRNWISEHLGPPPESYDVPSDLIVPARSLFGKEKGGVKVTKNPDYDESKAQKATTDRLTYMSKMESASAEFHELVHNGDIVIPTFSERVDTFIRSLAAEGWHICQMYGVPIVSGRMSGGGSAGSGVVRSVHGATSTLVEHFILFERNVSNQQKRKIEAKIHN